MSNVVDVDPVSVTQGEAAIAPRANMPQGRKFLALEAVRGIAACVVVLHHFCLQFLPHLHGRLFPDDPVALVRSPAFIVMNGTAAVAVFFVLSGFVLTVKAFEAERGGGLVIGALKRWPRLVLPVAVANLFAGCFLAAGLFAHQDRWWLRPESYGGTLGVLYFGLKEGGVTTFTRGSALFNVSIWTMHYELIGSFLSFAAAIAMLRFKNWATSAAVGCAAMLLIALAGGEGGGLFATMVAGTLLARIYIRFRSPVRWSWPTLVPILAAIVVLGGYDGVSRPVGFYSFLQSYASVATERSIHAVGGILIVAFVLYHLPTRTVLSGKVAAFLGRMSFPIYLVHLPVLHGIVFHLHRWLAPALGTGIATGLSFVAMIVLTFGLGYPLMRLDIWWVGVLNRGVALVVSSRRFVGAPPRSSTAAGVAQESRL